MPVQTFTTSQAASQVAVSESTARRIYDDYTDPSIRLPRGRKGERRLTANDIEVIKEVIRLKGDNPKLTPEEIREHLTGLVFSAPITESSQAAQEGRSEAIASIAVITEAMRHVTAPLEIRLQALESQRPTWRDVIILVLAGVIVGVMIGLSVWWFQ